MLNRMQIVKTEAPCEPQLLVRRGFRASYGVGASKGPSSGLPTI
jgi:hypothetical protein